MVTVPRPDGSGAPPWTADYEAHRRAAPGRHELTGRSWLALLDQERTFVVLSSRSYEEIADLRFWLRDAILVRWLQECQRFAGPDAAVSVDVLALRRPERDPQVVQELKATCWAAGLRTCLYSGSRLDRVHHLDHVLPFAHFSVDLFWNLVPADPSLNLAKRDRLPELDPPLETRYRRFLADCLALDTPLLRRQLDATWRRYFQEPRAPAAGGGEVVDQLVQTIRLSWRRLERAGVDVWDRVA